MTKRAREDSLSQDTAMANNVIVSERPAAKYTQLSEQLPLESRAATYPPPIECHLPPHGPLEFPTASDHEHHYLSAHTNRCISCLANLPSPHLLTLHITEHHDPIALSRRERGERIYACFVEGCDKLCMDWKKRRSHMVDKHGFPRNYDFLVVDTGVDGRRSLLRAGVDEQGHRRSSRDRAGDIEDTRCKGETRIAEEDAVVADGYALGERRDGLGVDNSLAQPQREAMRVDGLTRSLSALELVPRNVTFGKPRKGAGLARS